MKHFHSATVSIIISLLLLLTLCFFIFPARARNRELLVKSKKINKANRMASIELAHAMSIFKSHETDLQRKKRTLKKFRAELPRQGGVSTTAGAIRNVVDPHGNNPNSCRFGEVSDSLSNKGKPDCTHSSKLPVKIKVTGIYSTIKELFYRLQYQVHGLAIESLSIVKKNPSARELHVDISANLHFYHTDVALPDLRKSPHNLSSAEKFDWSFFSNARQTNILTPAMVNPFHMLESRRLLSVPVHTKVTEVIHPEVAKTSMANVSPVKTVRSKEKTNALSPRPQSLNTLGEKVKTDSITELIKQHTKRVK